VALALLLPLYKHHPKAVITTLISGLLAALWVHLLKAGIDLPRPALSLDRETIVILGPVLKHGSFPSGHTATLFALLGSLTLWLRLSLLRELLPILMIIGSLAALSRIAVGAHWPMDILIGATIGWVSALMGSALTRHLPSTPQVLSWLGRFLTICVIYLLFFHHTGYINAQPVLHVIALLVLGQTCLQHLKKQAPSVAKATVTSS
jgi:membrane-associated phospholipid phosphatase